MIKEYWVNEYEYPLTKGRWFGERCQNRMQAIINCKNIKEFLVGRWHVKLK